MNIRFSVLFNVKNWKLYINKCDAVWPTAVSVAITMVLPMPLPLPLRQCNTLLTYSLRVSPFSLIASIMYLEIYSFVSIAIELELEFQVKEKRKMRPVIDFIFHWSLCQNLWFPWEYTKICKFQIIQRLFKRSLIAFFSYIHNIGIASVVAVPSLRSIQQILCIIFLSDSHWIFFPISTILQCQQNVAENVLFPVKS